MRSKVKSLIGKIGLVILILAALIVVGCSNQSTPSAPSTPSTPETPDSPAPAKTLRIGGTAPLTGPPSAAGLEFKMGWTTAADEINNNGGIKVGDQTYMVEMLVEDSKATSEGATTAATKLINQDGVKFMMGDIADFLIPPVYTLTSEAGVLFVIDQLNISSARDGYADVGPDKPFLVRLTIGENEIQLNPVKYMVEKYPNAKKIGCMALDFPEYDGFFPEFSSQVKELGLEVVGEFERFPPGTFDFSAQVMRMLESGPDAMYISNVTPDQVVLYVKTAREAGFNGPIMCNSPADVGLVAQAGSNISDVFGNAIAIDAPNNTDSVKKAIELGRAKYDKAYTSACLMSYDALMLLAQCMEKAQSVDPQEVQNTIETLTNSGDLKSIFGDAYMGGKETLGVNRAICKPYPLSCLTNGQGEFIDFYLVDVP